MDALRADSVTVVIIVPHLGDPDVNAFCLLFEGVGYNKSIRRISGDFRRVSRHRFILRTLVRCGVSGFFHAFLIDGIDDLPAVFVHLHIAEHNRPGSIAIRAGIFLCRLRIDDFSIRKQTENHMVRPRVLEIVIVHPHLPCNNIPCLRNVGIHYSKAL